jgi:rubrerythrin
MIEAIKKGIDMEFQTRNFYRRVSEGIKNKKASRMVAGMARDEESHAVKLQALLKKLSGERYESDPNAPPNPKYKVAEAAVYVQAVAKEIVSVGIFIETESIKRYTELRDAATEKDEKRLFSDLVLFEEGHKAKLQNEFRRLEAQEALWDVV